jgi:hypothetical protein
VDETGRVLHDDKHGVIPLRKASILLRLDISNESWLRLTTDFEVIFKSALVTAEHLSEFNSMLNYNELMV